MTHFSSTLLMSLILEKVNCNRKKMLEIKFKVYFGFVFLAFSVAGFVQSDQVLSKIVNGDNTLPGEFPFQVSLQKNDVHKCGGSIINKYFVITAAHCVDEEVQNPYVIKVVAGTWKLSKPQSIHFGQQIILYGFSRENSLNDIALLKVKNPFIFSESIKPVFLPEPNQNLNDGQKVVVTGWGYTRTHANKPSDILKRVHLEIQTHESCKKAYEGEPFPIAETHVCAQAPKRGICSSDSGGPMTVNGVLFGIVSWGSNRGCATLKHPDVFTKVSQYINWIVSNINKKPKY